MVYIAPDGTIQNTPRPWGFRRLRETFWSLVNAIELFIQTLLPLPSSSRAVNFRSSSGNDNSSSRRNNRHSGTFGRMGGFRTMSDIAPPPPAFGGCSGGSCGM